jgi:hypothetical protein
MGSIRECNPLGKQVLLYFCKELTFLWTWMHIYQKLLFSSTHLK